MAHYVVVGAGQAGQALVAKLRSAGFDGAITLIGAEPVPPYQRPPLSKAYLLGEMAEERLYLRPAEWYRDNGIDLRTGCTVAAIDTATRRVRLRDGADLGYDALALTTGSLPRRLPAAIGGDLAGVFTMRDLADADALAPEMTGGRRALIVGGGYIGLEAAAVAAKRGLTVTLVEMADRILQRVAAAETSDYFRALHQGHGVDIREGTGLTRLVGTDGRLTGAELADGTRIAADLCIVGIGIAPDTALAGAAGLACDNGIAVDETCRTSDPHVWAAGDCASFPHGGGRMRLESVGNAIDMSEAAALSMLGQGEAYVPQPWFWSDQFDVKLQIAGLGTGHDALHVRDGGDGARSHWYYRAGRLVAVDAMNDARAYMIGKRMIETGLTPDPAAVTDPASNLKALLRP